MSVEGLASGGMTEWLSRLGWRRWMERSAGALMVGVGVFLLWTLWVDNRDGISLTRL